MLVRRVHVIPIIEGPTVLTPLLSFSGLAGSDVASHGGPSPDRRRHHRFETRMDGRAGSPATTVEQRSVLHGAAAPSQDRLDQQQRTRTPRLGDPPHTRLLRMPTIATRYDRRDNTFTPLRLVLSVLVLYSHSFALAGHGPGIDPAARLTHGQTNFGDLAVSAFFALSGFLVTQSLVETRGSRWLFDFFVKRALRIWPALVLVAILTTAVVGPLLTRLPLADYVNRPGSFTPWGYFVDAITFNAFGWHTYIRDLFTDTPFGHVVNGSLWSLRFEVALYIALVVVAVIVRRRLVLVVAPLTGIVLVLAAAGLVDRYALPLRGWVFSNQDLLISSGALFFSGASFYVYRQFVPMSGRLVAAAAVLFAVLVLLSQAPLAVLLVLPYLSIGLGLTVRAGWYDRRIGDYSYGTYLFAFPIQQIVAHFFAPMGPTRMFVIALPITLGVAILSWHLVEQPALRLKGRLTRRPAPGELALQPVRPADLVAP